MVRISATIIELDMSKLDEILRRVEAKELHADDYEAIRAVIESYVGLFYAVGDKNTTIARLRKLLFGSKTEKTAAVVGGLQLNPNIFYAWQKQLFENGGSAFQRSRKARVDPRDRRSGQLEAKLTQKNEVLAELMQEHVALKKALGEP